MNMLNLLAIAALLASFHLSSSAPSRLLPRGKGALVGQECSCAPSKGMVPFGNRNKRGEETSVRVKRNGGCCGCCGGCGGGCRCCGCGGGGGGCGCCCCRPQCCCQKCCTCCCTRCCTCCQPCCCGCGGGCGGGCGCCGCGGGRKRRSLQALKIKLLEKLPKTL